jgi:hypothetical protein
MQSCRAAPARTTTRKSSHFPRDNSPHHPYNVRYKLGYGRPRWMRRFTGRADVSFSRFRPGMRGTQMPDDASQNALPSATPAADPAATPTTATQRVAHRPPHYPRPTTVIPSGCHAHTRRPPLHSPTNPAGEGGHAPAASARPNPPNHANARQTTPPRTPAQNEPTLPSSLFLCFFVSLGPNSPALPRNRAQHGATKSHIPPRRRKTNPPPPPRALHGSPTTDHGPRTNPQGQHLPCSCP